MNPLPCLNRSMVKPTLVVEDVRKENRTERINDKGQKTSEKTCRETCNGPIRLVDINAGKFNDNRNKIVRFSATEDKNDNIHKKKCVLAKTGRWSEISHSSLLQNIYTQQTATTDVIVLDPDMPSNVVKAILEVNPKTATEPCGNSKYPPLWQFCRHDTPDMESIQSIYDANPRALLLHSNISIVNKQQQQDEEKIDEETLLHYVVERANFDVLEWILEKDPDAARRKDKKGNLPLHRLCRSLFRSSKSSKFFQRLIDAYPEGPNTRNNNGNLPLHEYVYSNFESIHWYKNDCEDGLYTLLGANPDAWDDGHGQWLTPKTISISGTDGDDYSSVLGIDWIIKTRRFHEDKSFLLDRSKLETALRSERSKCLKLRTKNATKSRFVNMICQSTSKMQKSLHRQRTIERFIDCCCVKDNKLGTILE